jgi:hypothetical protein
MIKRVPVSSLFLSEGGLRLLVLRDVAKDDREGVLTVLNEFRDACLGGEDSSVLATAGDLPSFLDAP